MEEFGNMPARKSAMLLFLEHMDELDLDDEGVYLVIAKELEHQKVNGIFVPIEVYRGMVTCPCCDSTYVMKHTVLEDVKFARHVLNEWMTYTTIELFEDNDA